MKNRNLRVVLLSILCLFLLVLMPISSVFFFLPVYSCLGDALSGELTEREDILALYHDHEDAFLLAAETKSFDALTEIKGIQEIHVQEDYVEIDCGGLGFGSNTAYFGIFYSETDDLCAESFAATGETLVLLPKDNGYYFEETYGDNTYYVEPLGNHYFYYELHF